MPVFAEDQKRRSRAGPRLLIAGLIVLLLLLVGFGLLPLTGWTFHVGDWGYLSFDVWPEMVPPWQARILRAELNDDTVYLLHAGSWCWVACMHRHPKKEPRASPGR